MVLGAVAGRLRVDPSSRAFRERVAEEWDASLDRLSPLRREMAEATVAADSLVFDLYELASGLQAIVDREYGPA